jgi:hypothetical protein
VVKKTTNLWGKRKLKKNKITDEQIGIDLFFGV